MSSLPSNRVVSTREITDEGTTKVTYHGYWWGGPTRFSIQSKPSTISPFLGDAPPNGPATITVEYEVDKSTNLSVSILGANASLTKNADSEDPSSSPERVDMSYDLEEDGVFTATGTGRVGAMSGESRPLIFMKGLKDVAESQWKEKEKKAGWRQIGIGEVDVYIEALGDWASRVTDKKTRYRLASSPKRE